MKSKTILLSFVVLMIASLLPPVADGQTQTYTAPVNWIRYKSSDLRVSFLMPKLPIVIDSSYECSGERARTFGSYANGVAFVVRTAVKIKVPRGCLVGGGFGEANVTARINALKARGEMEVATNDPNIIELAGERTITKIIKDFANDRWIELSVFGAGEGNNAVAEFLGSLEKGKKTQGVEIRGGADRVLGDGSGVPESKTADTPAKPKVAIENPGGNGSGSGQGNGNGVGPVSPSVQPKVPVIDLDKPKALGIQIALKARANYTDRARMEEIQGKVVLRVTFGADGSVGAISVVKGLEFGLTEQAITAAKKILFVPPSRNGVMYTVTKPVEYSFSLF